MPKKCPDCKTVDMEEKAPGVHVCPNCKSVYATKKARDIAFSIFTVT